MRKKVAQLAIGVLLASSFAYDVALAENTSLAVEPGKYSYDLPNGRNIFQFGATGVGLYLGKAPVSGPEDVWSAVFPPCSTVNNQYCIESVSSRRIGTEEWIMGSASEWTPSSSDPIWTDNGTAQQTKLQTTKFYTDQKSNLPRGGVASVWQLKNSPHGGGIEYVVGAGIYFYKNYSPPQTTQAFNFGIVPAKMGLNPIPGNRNSWPMNYGERYQFPKNMEFKLVLRIGDYVGSIGGWFEGRVLKPRISLEQNKLIISGSPAWSLYGVSNPLPCTEWPEQTPRLVEVCASGALNQSNGWYSFNNSYEAAVKPSQFYPQGSFSYWEKRMPIINEISQWGGVDFGINTSGNCKMAFGEVAFVSSNATIYSTRPPQWNKDDQTLNYGLGSFHLKGDGSLNQGNFYIVIPNSFAKCLWGFDAQKARVITSITEDGGEQTNFTSKITSDKENLYVEIEGFSFSSPKIKVRLEEKIEKNPEVEIVPKIETSKNIKKNRLVCVKGKSKKELFSKSASCPKGYKLQTIKS